jgi:uncharacterized glyoxalase superfamily protein PhnB
MKHTPPGWPRISSALFYDDPRRAIDWLCSAFGFQIRLVVEGENGRVEHSELEYGDGLIMVAGAGPGHGKPGQPWREKLASPPMVGGRNTQNLCVYVDDADAHCEHARKAGAEIAFEPMTTDYGDDYWSDRGYCAVDVGGHVWWFMQRLSTGGKPHGG